MKITKSQLLILLAICVLLFSVILIVHAPKKQIKIITPEAKPRQAELTGVKKIELPPKEAKTEEAEEKLPEMDISEIPDSHLEAAIQEQQERLGNMESPQSAPEAESQKYRKVPTSEQMRDIRQQGLKIY